MSQSELPQMRSIWLDEDQEAEKLYGMQSQHALHTEVDDDDSYDIEVLNSNKPMIGNKINLVLAPLAGADVGNEVSQIKASKEQFIKKQLNRLKKFSRFCSGKTGKKDLKSKDISKPFAFQHVSHCGDRLDKLQNERGVGLKRSQSTIMKKTTKMVDDEENLTRTYSRPLSCAFVTESIPEYTPWKGDRGLKNLFTPLKSKKYPLKRCSSTTSSFSHVHSPTPTISTLETFHNESHLQLAMPVSESNSVKSQSAVQQLYETPTKQGKYRTTTLQWDQSASLRKTKSLKLNHLSVPDLVSSSCHSSPLSNKTEQSLQNTPITKHQFAELQTPEIPVRKTPFRSRSLYKSKPVPATDPELASLAYI